MRKRWIAIILAVSLWVTASIAAVAQGERAQRRAGQGPLGQRRGVSLAQIPLSALDAAVHLSADQKSKIGAIHTKLQSELQNLLPTPGTPPEPGAMREALQKRAELNRKASQEIESLLTSEQKAKLPELIRKLTLMRAAGIPLMVYDELKLTNDQIKKIIDIGETAQKQMREALSSGDRNKFREIRREAQQKTLNVLTAEQKEILQKFSPMRPRRERARQGV
jgi:Spy/CpxP family protein refolding chaperone